MLAHPLTQTAEHLVETGALDQASATLWQMLQQGQGLDKRWLDCLVQLVIRLDAAGFRPQSQHWLALAAPVAQGLGLVLRPPLPIAPHLAPEAFDAVQNKMLKRYPAFESPAAYLYVIEVAGNCSLRCPSCPVGNMPDEAKPGGLMPIERFEKILEKISQDRPGTPIAIHLFNWGEPLLHPQLDHFIRLIRERGWQSIVSTTLNIDRGLAKLVQAAPDLLKVSMSGWTQEDYGTTHVRGKVENVKENLRQLRQLMDDQAQQQPGGPMMDVSIGYHLYRHNLAGAAHVRQFAAELGFGYMENNAVIQPMERNLDLLAGRAGPVTEQIAARLLVHPIEISKINLRRRSGQFDCELRFNMTAIDVDGSVALCCGTYSRHLAVHQDFLAASVQELEAAKYQSTFCRDCMHGGFAYTVNDVL